MDSVKPDVSLFVLRALKQEGIKDIFFVPGFVTDPFLPNFSKAGINAIVAAHEGGAAYMADGYGRARGDFGVCMGIGGPGVTNMVTAVSAAYADRAPILVVAGKIPAKWEGRGTFQDSSASTGIDDVAIMRTMTGFAAVVPEVGLLESFLKRAVVTMRGNQKLPTFLSIPEDIHSCPYSGSYTSQPRGPYRILDSGAALLQVPPLLDTERIVILAGNGCVHSGASKELQQFANQFSIPVVTTMRAKGAISEEDDMSFGVFGVGGSLQADKLVLGSPQIPKAEVILTLGATLNENNTHFRHDRFIPDKALVRVDVNPISSRSAEYKEHFVMGDAKTFIEWATDNSKVRKALGRFKRAREKWIESVRATQYYDDEPMRAKNQVPIHPALVIARLRKATPKDSVLVVDSGAHTFFAGHHWTSYGPNEFLFSSTMGPMGYGIAMGIGAKLARPDKSCICIVGDGSMLMHGMELHTAARYKIPIIVVVINNSALGNVYLRARNQGKDAAELAKIPTHDWSGFAHSLGATAIQVGEPSELPGAFSQALEHTSKPKATPFLIDIICDRECKAPNQLAT